MAVKHRSPLFGEPFQNFKIEIHIFPSVNFPEAYRLEGLLKRKELQKKQLGIGIEFVA